MDYHQEDRIRIKKVPSLQLLSKTGSLSKHFYVGDQSGLQLQNRLHIHQAHLDNTGYVEEEAEKVHQHHQPRFADL